jgi:hypothetical protein
MNLLQALAQLWQHGYLVRVQWDSTLMVYLVELVDKLDSVEAKVKARIHFEDQLLPWITEQLYRIQNTKL